MPQSEYDMGFEEECEGYGPEPESAIRDLNQGEDDQARRAVAELSRRIRREEEGQVAAFGEVRVQREVIEELKDQLAEMKRQLEVKKPKQVSLEQGPRKLERE